MRSSCRPTGSRRPQSGPRPRRSLHSPTRLWVHMQRCSVLQAFLSAVVWQRLSWVGMLVAGFIRARRVCRCVNVHVSVLWARWTATGCLAERWACVVLLPVQRTQVPSALHRAAPHQHVALQCRSP